MNISIVGCGSGGLALACWLGQEYNIGVWNRTALTSETVSCEGLYNLSARVTALETLEEVAAFADVIMIVTTANAHAAIAEGLKPFVYARHTIILNPGRSGGARQVKSILPQCCVAEAQSLVFACRKTNHDKVWIFGHKKRVGIATANPLDVNRALIMPEFKPVLSIVETSLANYGCVLHPAILLANLSRLGSGFDFYQSVNDAVCALIESVDGERMRLASAIGIPAQSCSEWVSDAYGLLDTGSLRGNLVGNPAYQNILAPLSIDVRYVNEDIPFGLVPMYLTGLVAGVDMPIIKSMIDIFSALCNKNFLENGRPL